MFRDWNFWFSVVTAVVAIVALIQTNKQTKLSNKQHLFDRRLDAYIKINDLVTLYSENRTHIINEQRDDVMFGVDSDFMWLTNNSYLECTLDTIEKTLDKSKQKILLTKLEEIKKLSLQASLIFEGNEVNEVNRFVISYKDLLFEMYQYKIILDRMEKHNKEYNHKYDIEELGKRLGEPILRETLVSAYDELEDSYSILVDNDVMNKLQKQLKLYD